AAERDLRAEIAGDAAGVDVEVRPLRHTDLDVAGHRLRGDAALARRLDAHVAGDRLGGDVAADRGCVDVAAHRLDDERAADGTEASVAADGLDLRVAGDLALDQEVTRGRFRRDRGVAAAQLRVGRRSRQLRSTRMRDARADVQPRPAEAEVADRDRDSERSFRAELDDEAVADELDPRVLDEPLGAVDGHRRLVAVNGLDLDVAGGDLHLELDRLRRVERVDGHLRPPCGRRTWGRRTDRRRSSGCERSGEG